MKARVDELVPDGGNRIWLNNREFFHRGHNGQWRDLLDEAGLLRDADLVAELAPPDLAVWAHAGRHGANTFSAAASQTS